MPLPVIEKLYGRRGDTVVTPAGRNIPAPLLTLVFKDLVGLRRTQIVQMSGSQLRVVVDLDARAPREIVETVRTRMEEVARGEMGVDVQVGGEFKVSKTGKIPFVVRDSREAPKP